MTTTPDLDTSVLDELLQRRTALRDEARALRDAIHAEHARLTAQKYGVKVGSIVKARGGRLYRVAEVDARWFNGRPWLTANPQLKSGAYGTGVHNLYDWVLIE